MADPLTILGAIASVIQISSTVITLIKTVKEATNARQKLLAEIHATTALCRILQDYAELDAEPWRKTFQVLCEGSNGPLNQFQAKLEYLQDKLAPDQKGTSIHQSRSDNSTATRRMKAWIQSAKWPFTKDEVRATLADIDRQKSLFTIALSNDSLRLMAMMHEGVGNITRGVDTIRSNQENEQRRKSIARLSTIDFGATHDDISSSRAKGTGKWLLDSTAFRNWLQSPLNAVLWCYGIPGAGKTTMSSLMIDHLRTLQDDSLSSGVAGIYCTYKEPQTIANLLGSLLQQLVERLDELPPSLSGERSLSSREISTALIEVFPKYDQIFLVIDALDECTSAIDLLKEIQKLCESASQSNLHIVATSRTGITDIEHNLDADMQLEIRSDENDVRLYLEGSLREQGRLSTWVSESADFKSSIIESILPRLSGMFLLARLYVDLLAQMPTKRRAREALKTLPEGVDAIYEEAWNRICAQKRDQADMGKKVISWTVCATRALRLPELRHGLAVEESDAVLDPEGLPDNDSLTSFCAGLVVIDEQSNRISLVHPTAYEYFVKHQQDLIPNAHDLIAVACTTYLLMNPFRGACLEPDDFIKRYRRNKLLGYAAVNWGSHVRISSSKTSLILAHLLLQTDATRSAAVQALVLNTSGTFERLPEWPVLSSAETRRSDGWSRWTFENSTKPIGALHLASYFGLAELAKSLARSRHKIDELGMGATAVHWAVLGSQNTVLEMLLQWGASVSVRQQSFCLRRWTEWRPRMWDNRDSHYPLQLAASLGNVVAIEILSRYGSEINAYSIRADLKTALSAALTNNHIAAAHSLRTLGADVNQDSELFFDLAQYGRSDELKMLITSGAHKRNLNRALIAAARLCHYEILTILIDAGVDVDGCSDGASTPERHDIENSQYLASQRNDDGKEATTINCEEGDRMHLYRQNSGIAYRFAETPLIQVVASSMHVKIAKMKACAELLIDSGAKVNRVGARNYLYASELEIKSRNDIYKDKTSPLHTAAYYRNLDMINFLIEKGANINLVIDNHYVPLKSALDSESYMNPDMLEEDWAHGAESGPETTSLEVKVVLQLLLDRGANPDLCGPDDRARIEQLTSLSPDECSSLRTLQMVVAEEKWEPRHELSFRDRRTRLRMVLQGGADPELCCERERQRIRDMLSWTDEEIVELDRKRTGQLDEEMAQYHLDLRARSRRSTPSASDSEEPVGSDSDSEEPYAFDSEESVASESETD